MTDNIQDLLELVEFSKYNAPEIHSDIQIAEREREMSSLQFVRVTLLRLEEAIRLRDHYTSMGSKFYNKSKNDFHKWYAIQGSAALAHPYHFEKKIKTPLFLKDYIKTSESLFNSTDEILQSHDLKLLWKLVDDYESWIIHELEKGEC